MTLEERNRLVRYLKDVLTMSFMTPKIIKTTESSYVEIARELIDDGQLDELTTAKLFGVCEMKIDPNALNRYLAKLYKAQDGEDENVELARNEAIVALEKLKDCLERAVVDDKDRKAKEKAEKKKGGKEDEEEKPIDIVISLVTYVNDSTAKNRTLDCALLVPATLSTEGELGVPSDFPETIVPWVPRPHLGHGAVEDTQEIVFAEAKDFFELVRSKKAETKEGSSITWDDYLAYCDIMAKKLFESNGIPQREYSTARATEPYLATGTCFAYEETLINATQALQDLYSDIEGKKDTEELRLFTSLLAADAKSRPNDIDSTCGDVGAANKHAGTIGEDFPLSDNQRDAVQKMKSLSQGQLLAVSGPPGTGKTTLLQSVVADLIVHSILDAGGAEPVPPVIVGTSNNNQAVTNIIDSFSSVQPSTTTSLNTRWLPALRDPSKAMEGLGTYFPSIAKAEAASKKYLVGKRKMQGVYTDFSAKKYVSDAKGHLLEAAARYFGKAEAGSVSAVAKELRDRLKKIDDCRLSLLTPGKVTNRQAYVDVLLNEGARMDADRRTKAIQKFVSADEKQLNELLDTYVRPVEFWLATHYYECRWLMACGCDIVGEPNAHDKNDKKFKPDANYIVPADLRWKTDKDTLEMYYHQLACLTPCMVMTLYQVPKMFNYSLSKTANFNPMYGFIDLLIVDESGQVDTAVGAPLFALAKRALVVGDVNQLLPVWGLDPEEDKTWWSSNHGGVDDVWTRMSNSGLTASNPSCVMKAAMESCEKGSTYTDETLREHTEGGLFLPDHRRCYDEIIEYCNALVYSGRLKPRRGKFADGCPLKGLLPPFGRVPIIAKSASVNGSRCNDGEAEAVATWIIKNFDVIHGRYGNSVKAKDLLAVVTPFKCQATLIQQKLTESGWGHAKDITVGTAHKLQGAERKVILFSLVYSSGDAPGFVDANPQLMNVAVSRAKDCFIVFGDPAILDGASADTQPPVSTALLGKYSKGHEVPLELPQDSEPQVVEPQVAEPKAPAHQVDAPKAAMPKAVRLSAEDERILEAEVGSKRLSATKVLGVLTKLSCFKGVELPKSVWALNVILGQHGYLENTDSTWVLTQEMLDYGAQMRDLNKDDGTKTRYAAYSQDAIHQIISVLLSQ